MTDAKNEGACGASHSDAGLGVFKKEWFKVSEFPDNFIPAGAKEFTVTDEREGTVKGFYTDSGDIHIQEIIATPNA